LICRKFIQIQELKEDGMAAAAGLLNHTAASGQPLAGTRVFPMASSNTDPNSTGTKSSASGITANDFLTLLVTEMKNQDPTANTDPNQYINQLVNVNSLQQLISINETLTSAYGSSSANAYAQPAAEANTAASISTKANAASEPTSQPNPAAVFGTNVPIAGNSKIQAFISNLAHGNLCCLQSAH
jgi:flagellar basal-body rod modification protein FlgD